MKNTIKLIIQLCNLILISAPCFSQYPFEDKIHQHFINGNVGEERGGRTRYHYGVDFQKTGGTHVHSIEGGVLKLISGYPAINHFGYIHVSNLQYRVNEFVPAGAYLGDVNYSDAHLHLQQNNISLSVYPPDSWEDGGNWINPIGFLDPLDRVAPRIEYAKLFRDQNWQTEITQNQILYGHIDILVNTEDARIETDGSSGGYGIASYKIDCELLNTSHQLKYKLPGIAFDEIPSNASASSEFGPRSDYNIPDFEYWVSNDPNHKKFERYLNIRQKNNENFSVSSKCPDEAKFIDGDYIFKITSFDYSGNKTEKTLPATPAQYFIDNFQPYIQSIDVLIDGINIYSAQWECSSKGPVFSGYECQSTNVGPSSIITVNLITSEPMLDLKGRITEFPGSFISLYQISKLNWTISFQNFNYLKDGDKGHLEFSGTDLNGNQILDLKAMSGGKIKSNHATDIPIRVDNNNWKPQRKGGDIDNVHEFCFRNCHYLQNDLVANLNSPGCISSDDLDLKFDAESYNGAEDGWIRLDIMGNSDFYVKWTDSDDNIISEGWKAYDLTGLKAGEYCYLVRDGHCCEISSCVILCPSIILDLISSITPPLDCESKDGAIRIINCKTSGGKEPYSFHLEDVHGDEIILNTSTGKYENLSNGNYKYIATDINGCTGVYNFRLSSPEQFEVYPFLSNICDGEDGSIHVDVFSSFYPDDKYNFEWSTGFNQEEESYSDLNNLSEGTYCLTISSVNSPCIHEECFTLKGSGKDLILAHTQRMPCKDQANGSIQITLNGGSKPYKYHWENGDFRPNRNSLKPGNYCVTVTDACQNQLKECFDLTKLLTVKLNPDFKCPEKKVDIYSDVYGGNPPYSYQWIGNIKTKDLMDVPLGGIYKITVTDKTGCTVTTEINTYPIELVNIVKPCEGFRDGEVTIKINNPKNQQVDVYYDYSPCEDCIPFYKISKDYSNPVQFTLKELAGNKEYHFYVFIGACSFEMKIILQEEILTKEYKRFEVKDGLASCIYDLVCKGNRIEDGKREEPILKHIGGNCSKLFFKECASVEVSCLGHAGTVSVIQGKKIHMRRLELISYAQKLGLDPSGLSGNFCDHVWICQDDPFCIVASARGELGGKFKGIEKEGDCYKIKCRSFFGLINQDYKICGEDFIPDDFLPYYRNDRYYRYEGGKPKTLDCTPITLNFTDILECWSKFVGDDGDLFYNSSTAHLVDQFRDKKERFCGWITFCKEDYSLIRTNIYDLECREFSPPVDVGPYKVNSTCEPHDFNGNTIVFCECDDQDIIAKKGICLEPRQLPKRCTAAFQIPEEPRPVQFLPFQNGNTYFSNFSSFHQSENFITVNGIYRNENGDFYYQKFDPEVCYNPLQNFEGALFVNQNAKSDQVHLILEGISKNDFELYSGNLNHIYISHLSAEFLHFVNFYPGPNGFVAVATFKGHLSKDNELVAQAEDTSLCIFYRNDLLNETRIHIINATDYYNSSGSIYSGLLKASSQHVPIFIDGNILVSSNSAFKMTNLDSNGNLQISEFPEMNGTIKILKYSRIEFLNINYILANAQGNVLIGNDTILLPETNQILLLKIVDQKLVWYRNFNQTGIDLEEICFEVTGFNGSVIGMNVGSDFNLFNSPENNTNANNKDIVIIRYDQDGNLISQNQYGSPTDDENLKSLFYSDENVLYLGGNISGSGNCRSIGDVDIFKPEHIKNSAYISYINFNEINGIRLNNNQRKDTLNYSRPSLNITQLKPNPVKDELYFETSNLSGNYIFSEIYNTTGTLILQKSIDNRYPLSINIQELKSGFYILKVRDQLGRYALKRFVKI